MRTVKTLLAVLLIAWGVLAAGVRLTTPLLADYRDAFAAAASERLGAPVTIGSLKARWYGLRPLLELHEVSVGSAPDTLEIARIEVDLALTDLLRGAPLDALRLTVDGLQLTAVREPGGQIHLEGLGVTPTAGSGESPPALPNHLRLINTRVVWLDRHRERLPLPLDDIDILFDRDGDSVSLRASLHTASGRAEVAAQLNGRLGGTDWNGDSYIRIDNLDVARLLGDYLPPTYGLQSTLFDLQGWTHWQDALPVHNQGRFALRDVRLRPDAGGPLDLKLLAANFSVDLAGDSLRVGLSGLEVATPDHRWPRSDLALALSRAADGKRHVDLAAGYLRLEDITAMLQVRVPGAALGEALDAVRPRGELRALRVQGTLGDDAPRWRATARFAGIASDAWGAIPGVNNLSGELHGSDTHTVLTLDSHDSTLRFTELFRDALELPRIAGRIDVEHAGAGWEVRSDGLQADAAHIRTLTRVRLYQRPGERAFIDLQVDFRDGDAAFASRYYPAGIMGEALVRWLDRGIESGRVVSGSALLYGPLDDFAWEKTRSGSFQVVFDTEDVHLDYREGWPAISGLDAHVKFHGNQLDISSHAGQIYDSRIDQVSAHIASLDPISPIRIQGALSGPLRNNLRVLGEPALRERFGEFAELLRGDGDSRLALDFTVPLGSRGEYALDGRLTFAGNRLGLPEWDFAMQQIDGELGFTLDGLYAKGIRAVALGRPVAVDVLPRNDGTTRVRARGRFRPADVAGHVDGLPLTLLRGQAAFTVDVDVPPRSAIERPSLLAVRSDLRGIAVDLPEPFGKPAATRRPLAVRVPLSGNGVSGNVRYGGQLDALFSRDGQRVDVRLGGGEARLRSEPGIHVGGSLARLDVAAWRAALADLPQPDATPAMPLAVDLRIAQLDVDGLAIDDLQVSTRRDASAWRGSVSAANLAGSFELPLQRGREALRVDLDRLVIDLPADDASPPSPLPDAGAGPDPASLPGIHLRVAELGVGKTRLGRLEIVAEPVADGLDVSRLRIDGEPLTLAATGSWRRDGGHYHSRFDGHVEASDIGQLLVDLGYTRQVEEAALRGDFSLGWPGNPAQVHRATLNGRLDLDVGKGRLVELDPGVTRVVGLLNLNALTRRLRLDFSDFYKKGYSFDSIRGSFAFADGSATTDDLGIVGPTGRIDIRGATDLVDETFDQKVMVTPEFDATLPIAGTLAGGPVAGLAVLVAQQVMDKQVDRINRFDYAVTGPWAQPDVVQLDTGGTLSKILKPFSGGGEAAAPGGEPAQAATDERVPQAAPEAGDDAGKTPQPAPAAAAVPADGGDAAGGDDAGTGDTKPSRNPLRGLLNILKKGEPQGLDLPGESQR